MSGGSVYTAITSISPGERMDIVSKITSYAKAVPAGLKAAGQELAKTAVTVTGTDARPKAKRASPKKKTAARAATSKGKRPKAKRAAAKPKGRKAKR
jgi:hypothetical protein